MYFKLSGLTTYYIPVSQLQAACGESYLCVDCGNTITPIPDHEYTDSCDADCNVCGYERVAPHSYGAEWNTDLAAHWHACAGCSATTDWAEHEYDAPGDHTCNVCGAIVYVVTVGNVNAYAGGMVTVAISMADVAAVQAIGLGNLVYDADVLTLVNGEWLLDNADLSFWSTAYGEGAVALSSATDIDGAFFTLTFRVNDTAAVGEYSIGCEVAVNAVRDMADRKSVV